MKDNGTINFDNYDSRLTRLSLSRTDIPGSIDLSRIPGTFAKLQWSTIYSNIQPDIKAIIFNVLKWEKNDSYPPIDVGRLVRWLSSTLNVSSLFNLPVKIILTLENKIILRKLKDFDSPIIIKEVLIAQKNVHNSIDSKGFERFKENILMKCPNYPA